ncbi:MAG: YggT family protein [Betaproteobacteria bacterium]|nr:YggT family protein [Betaproteobacteria bacterium]
MLAEMLGIVVRYVGGFLVFMLLLRFHFQWLRVPFRNQVGEFVLATTSWMVLPARRLIPPVLGLDLASALCAWLLQALIAAILITLAGRDLSSAPGIAAGILFARALVDLVQYSAEILLVIVILMAVLSWISPLNPLQPVLDAVTRPFLRPIRRFIPPIANVDLSPVVLILVIFLLMVPLAELRGSLGGLF